MVCGRVCTLAGLIPSSLGVDLTHTLEDSALIQALCPERGGEVSKVIQKAR